MDGMITPISPWLVQSKPWYLSNLTRSPRSPVQPWRQVWQNGPPRWSPQQNFGD